MKKMLLVFALCSLLSGLIATSGSAGDYPSKPITIIVPWGAGGMSNVSTRMLGDKIKDILGQPIIYINKPGASGLIGIQALKKAKPDGYTIASGPMTSAFTSPYFLDSPPLAEDDFDYIGSYMPQERILFTTPDKPYQTWEEFIDYSRRNPGKISVGSGGAQWALEVMKSIARKEGIQWKYVMFKSGGEASSSILGGHVDVCETGTGTPAYQSARQGKLRVLVNLGSEKVPFFPEVRNMNDLGYPFATMLEYGMIVPRGVPEEIRAKLEDTLATVMQDRALMEKMGETGFTPRFLDGKNYRKIVKKAVESIPQLIEYTKDIH